MGLFPRRLRVFICQFSLFELSFYCHEYRKHFPYSCHHVTLKNTHYKKVSRENYVFAKKKMLPVILSERFIYLRTYTWNPSILETLFTLQNTHLKMLFLQFFYIYECSFVCLSCSESKKTRNTHF